MTVSRTMFPLIPDCILFFSLFAGNLILAEVTHALQIRRHREIVPCDTGIQTESTAVHTVLYLYHSPCCFLVAGIKCKDTLVIFAAKAFRVFFPLSKNHTASSKFTLE